MAPAKMDALAIPPNAALAKGVTKTRTAARTECVVQQTIATLGNYVLLVNAAPAAMHPVSEDVRALKFACLQRVYASMDAAMILTVLDSFVIQTRSSVRTSHSAKTMMMVSAQIMKSV